MNERPSRGARGNPWLALATLAAGAMMVSLDTTIVAVAQPELQAAFHAPLREVQWTTTAYLLPLATLLIVAGKIGDRFGHRRVFLIGTIGFTLTSGAIGMSPTISGVIALRALQGVFGALLQPPTLALLRTTFPADRLNLPIALRSGILGVATAAGPVVGGVLVQEFGWQAVFFLNVPIGIVVAAAGLRTLREARVEPGGTLDPVAVLLMCGCLLTLLWAAGNATQGTWSPVTVFGFLAVSGVFGVVFCLWERRARDPLLPLGLFHSAAFSAGVTLMFVGSFAIYGLSFELTFFLQNLLGFSPLRCGLEVLWLTFAMVLTGTAVGLTMRRTGPWAVGLTGISAIAVAALTLTRADQAGAGWGLNVCLILFGCGFSAVIVATTHLIIRGTPLRHAGLAGAMHQTAMQVGGSLGTAAMASVLATRVSVLLPGRLAEAGIQVPRADLGSLARSVSLGLTGAGHQDVLPAHLVREVFLAGLNSALLVPFSLAVAGLLVAAVLRGRRQRSAETRPALPEEARS